MKFRKKFLKSKSNNYKNIQQNKNKYFKMKVPYLLNMKLRIIKAAKPTYKQLTKQSGYFFA